MHAITLAPLCSTLELTVSSFLLSALCQAFDEKNIRRRVYDALNVLMAMDIISKEKKEIRWKGLPSNAQHDIEMMQREKRALEDSVAKKREHLQDLIMQVHAHPAPGSRNVTFIKTSHTALSDPSIFPRTSSDLCPFAVLQRVAFKRLVKRNVEREGATRDASTNADGSAAAPPASEEPRVPLPFIIINTNHQTIIQCEMTEDRSDVFFNFRCALQLHHFQLPRYPFPASASIFTFSSLLSLVPPPPLSPPFPFLFSVRRSTSATTRKC
jgi:hypothetical protein